MEDGNEVFPGFPCWLDDGYTQMPNAWFDVLQGIDNLAELKIVLYVIRHTWGYRNEDGERDVTKKITIDEFAYGRMRRDGTRLDSGTGLGLTAVKDGVKRATLHQYLVCDVDDSDLARIKKSYGLKMQEEEEEEEQLDGHIPTSDSRIPTADSHNPTSSGQNATTGSPECDTRSEKETPETNSGKETERERCLARSSFFDQAMKFIKEKKTVNLFELEKYMHRFIRVRGKQNIYTPYKNLAVWTGVSEDFLQLVLALQACRSHLRLDFTDERAYSPKHRMPRRPLTTKLQDYEELHWIPLIITYKD